MRNIYLLLFLLIGYFQAFSHPGIGIVYDGKNTIYYTDLAHVWKLDTETGKSEIYLQNIHTHELYLDKSGNLYGEHYWYLESEEKFKNYIWKVNANGEFHKIRVEQYGENNDFSFIRNNDFTSFEILKVQNTHEIVKRDSLSKTVLLKTELNHPTWKYLTGNEELLFIDYPSIYMASSGKLKLIAKDISSKRFPFSTQSDDHNIYGIWTDKNNSIYVAIYGGREVKKIDKKGNINRILKSDFLWSPVNGVFDKNGNLWLMECKIGGKIRVRKINQSDIENNASFVVENSIFTLILLSLLILIYRVINRKKHSKKSVPSNLHN